MCLDFYLDEFLLNSFFQNYDGRCKYILRQEEGRLEITILSNSVWSAAAQA